MTPDAVWELLKEHHKNQTPVKGRVLNGVNGGHAVGLCGLVAFCPFSKCSVLTASRIGILQPFLIDSLSEERRNIIVSDHRMELTNQRLRSLNEHDEMRA